MGMFISTWPKEFNEWEKAVNEEEMVEIKEEMVEIKEELVEIKEEIVEVHLVVDEELDDNTERSVFYFSIMMYAWKKLCFGFSLISII